MSSPVYYVLAGLLLLGGLTYWMMQPPTPAPVTDPLAAKALELVQNHEARQAPTLQQAILDRIEAMKSKGQGVRVGEWRVAPAGPDMPDMYVVSILIREEGSDLWIERDYAWRVNVKQKYVQVITLPAIHLMPFNELPPLPMDPDLSS